MRGLAMILSFLLMIVVGYWAYYENYKTQAALKQTEALHAKIGAQHQRLSMLRAEWAYLNRPDRLRDLAELNFETLQLLPLMPDRFGNVDQIAFPPMQDIGADEPLSVSVTEEAEL